MTYYLVYVYRMVYIYIYYLVYVHRMIRFNQIHATFSARESLSELQQPDRKYYYSPLYMSWYNPRVYHMQLYQLLHLGLD